MWHGGILTLYHNATFCFQHFMRPPPVPPFPPSLLSWLQFGTRGKRSLIPDQILYEQDNNQTLEGGGLWRHCVNAGAENKPARLANQPSGSPASHIRDGTDVSVPRPTVLSISQPASHHHGDTQLSFQWPFLTNKASVNLSIKQGETEILVWLSFVHFGAWCERAHIH